MSLVRKSPRAVTTYDSVERWKARAWALVAYLAVLSAVAGIVLFAVRYEPLSAAERFSASGPVTADGPNMIRVGYVHEGTFSMGFLLVNDGPFPVKIQRIQMTGQNALMVPVGLEGFATPTIRADLGVVTLAYAGAGNRAFLLTESVDGRLSPPLEANVRGVLVRGIEGRYSPDRGLLEWVEDEVTISLTSTTLTLDELLVIATLLREP